MITEDGYGTPPAGPGWGTDLDEAVLAKYPPADYTPIASHPSRFRKPRVQDVSAPLCAGYERTSL